MYNKLKLNFTKHKGFNKIQIFKKNTLIGHLKHKKIQLLTEKIIKIKINK